jgi:hydrogenase nickel incorporation protein HypA/HybF
MHELSIALSILDRAREEASRRGGVHVSAIHVRVGPLSGVDRNALLSAYELARECSPFAGSQLVVEDVPVVIYCETCAAERCVESIQSFRCSCCGSPSAKLVSGRELEITAMEILE